MTARPEDNQHTTFEAQQVHFSNPPEDCVIGSIPGDGQYVMSGALPVRHDSGQLDSSSSDSSSSSSSSEDENGQGQEETVYPLSQKHSSAWGIVEPSEEEAIYSSSEEHSSAWESVGSNEQAGPSAALATADTSEIIEGDPCPSTIIKGGHVDVTPHDLPLGPIIKSIGDALVDQDSMYPYAHDADADVRESNRVRKEEPGSTNDTSLQKSPMQSETAEQQGITIPEVQPDPVQDTSKVEVLLQSQKAGERAIEQDEAKAWAELKRKTELEDLAKLNYTTGKPLKKHIHFAPGEEKVFDLAREKLAQVDESTRSQGHTSRETRCSGSGLSELFGRVESNSDGSQQSKSSKFQSVDENETEKGDGEEQCELEAEAAESEGDEHHEDQ